MLEHIHVDYKMYSTDYMIQKELKKLDKLSTISFDLETQAIYSIKDKQEAKELLKELLIEEEMYQKERRANG